MAGVQPCLDAADGVTNFLAAGEAPIYIGFGGMTGFDNTRLLDALIEAMAARRALSHPGWSGVDPKTLPDNFFAIGDTLAVPAHRRGYPSRRLRRLTLRRTRGRAFHRDPVRRRLADGSN